MESEARADTQSNGSGVKRGYLFALRQAERVAVRVREGVATDVGRVVER